MKKGNKRNAKKLRETYSMAKHNLDYNAMLTCINAANLYHVEL